MTTNDQEAARRHEFGAAFARATREMLPDALTDGERAAALALGHAQFSRYKNGQQRPNPATLDELIVKGLPAWIREDHKRLWLDEWPNSSRPARSGPRVWGLVSEADGHPAARRAARVDPLLDDVDLPDLAAGHPLVMPRLGRLAEWVNRELGDGWHVPPARRAFLVALHTAAEKWRESWHVTPNGTGAYLGRYHRNRLPPTAGTSVPAALAWGALADPGRLAALWRALVGAPVEARKQLQCAAVVWWCYAAPWNESAVPQIAAAFALRASTVSPRPRRQRAWPQCLLLSRGERPSRALRALSMEAIDPLDCEPQYFGTWQPGDGPRPIWYEALPEAPPRDAPKHPRDHDDGWFAAALWLAWPLVMSPAQHDADSSTADTIAVTEWEENADVVRAAKALDKILGRKDANKARAAAVQLVADLLPTPDVLAAIVHSGADNRAREKRGDEAA
jgi:hypothetical protein